MQDLNDKINNGGATADGQLTAGEWNQIPTEVQNAIESAGITLSGADLQQLIKAISAYSLVGEFYTGGGVADAYTAVVVSPRIAPPALINGMKVRFIPVADNTGASTLNAFGTGIVDIKLKGGVNDPGADELISGEETIVTYRTSPGAHWELKVDTSIDPKNSYAGLTLSNNVTDAAKDIDIAVGSAKDSTNSATLSLSSGLVKRMDASWVAGTNQGGLSSSLTLAASTWYHAFIVEISGSADILFDTSTVCANGITDHTVTSFRRIGSILTDSTPDVLPFEQTGINFQLDDAIKDIDITNSSTTATNRTLSVPLGVKTLAVFRASQQKAAALVAHIFYPVNVTDQAAGLDNASMVSASVASGNAGGQFEIMSNLSSQVRSVCNAASTTLRMHTEGWKDVSILEGL